jgi:hypothetical protein
MSADGGSLARTRKEIKQHMIPTAGAVLDVFAEALHKKFAAVHKIGSNTCKIKSHQGSWALLLNFPSLPTCADGRYRRAPTRGARSLSGASGSPTIAAVDPI